MIYIYRGNSIFLLKMAFISSIKCSGKYLYFIHGKAMNEIYMLYIYFYFTSQIKAISMNNFEFSFHNIEPI